MVFRKKRGGMIDVRELQKRGVVRVPRSDVSVDTNKDRFIEAGSKKTVDSSGDSNFFGFMDNSSNSTSKDNFSTESNGYTKREVDSKITELDNKIYKLENRIEVLEKKAGVNQSSGSSAPGPMGW